MTYYKTPEGKIFSSDCTMNLPIATKEECDAFEASLMTYKEKRAEEYPSTQEQLDMIYHDFDGWKQKIAEIKNSYPKE